MRHKKDRHFVKSSVLINHSNVSQKFDRRPIGLHFFKRILFYFLYKSNININLIFFI